MRGKKLLQIVIFISLFFAEKLFAEISVISPVQGKWGNKQMLVIENPSDGDYFYSVSGADPEESGFAYDSPVLLDVVGEVSLKITKVTSSSREQMTIDYSVDLDKATDETYSKFISSFFDTGIVNYTSSSILEIPQELYYAFGKGNLSFLKGQNLQLSSENVVSRYINCTLLDKKNNKTWSFVLKTFPLSAGTYGRRNVPFVIEDWNKITFTDKNLIYKIDSDFWSQPDEIEIDRSKSHMVYWQNIAYEQGNPVEFFVLPPKIEVKQKINDDGSVVFYTDDEDVYSLEISSDEKNSTKELFPKIGIDAFCGEHIKDDIEVEIFSSSIYQGSQKLSYNINKRPPSTPSITTNCSKIYARKPVELLIDSESGSDLYVSVSEPYIINDITSFKSDDILDIPSYKKVDGNNFKTMLSSDIKSSVLFYVKAYSVEDNNKSEISTYSVIIDQYNYFYDSMYTGEERDGTLLNPFNNFDECIDSINKVRNAILTVKGDVYLPQKAFSISSNLVIKNNGDVNLFLSSNTRINVQSATVEIIGCNLIQINNDKDKDDINSLIKFDKSILNLDSCIVSSVNGKNSVTFDGFYSSFSMRNCVFSANASSYSSFLTGENLRGSIENSKISLSGDTSLMFSLNNSDISLINNSINISANVGRVAEFVNSKATINNNIFEIDIKNKNVSEIIHADSKSKIKENGNVYK